MKFDQFPLVVVLGSQILYDESIGEYSLAMHTHMKVEAAAIAFRLGITKQMIFSGGYNFGVRYHNDALMENPNFSFSALTLARRARISEAQAMQNVAVEDFDVQPEHILLEELSMTTEENAAFVKVILKRTTFEGTQKIGVLALMYHMKRALPIFRKACIGIEVESVFAEDLLATKGEQTIDKIAKYYSTPKDGKPYDTKKIRALLSEGRSIAEMME